MANKAHVAKKYTIEYCDSCLNGLQSEINRLLYNHIGGFSYSGEDVECAEHIEVSREELRDLIDELRCKPQMLNHYDTEFASHEYSVDELTGIFEKWISESDQDNSFIVVDWF